MKIVIVGTDPAGLYLACLVKARAPQSDVAILDTGAPDRSGASPHILTNPVKPKFELHDGKIAAAVLAATQSTGGVRVVRDGEVVTTAGHAYTFIGAQALADVLRAEAVARGCRIETSADAARTAPAGADVIVIADGADSVTRAAMPDGFKPDMRPLGTRYAVLGTDKAPAQATFLFRRSAAGFVHAFHYPESKTPESQTPESQTPESQTPESQTPESQTPESQTPESKSGGALIVEAPAATIAAAGLDGASPDKIAAFCKETFGADLNGAKVTGRSGWRAFTAVRNATWTSGNAVLLGAAAYNAHPSIGLGARAGLEDAEALATLLTSGGEGDALLKFEAVRRPRAESLQRAASASQAWFEHVDRYAAMPLPQFAYALLTRSMRLNHEDMRALAPELTESVEAIIAGDMRSKTNRPPPPMFTPIMLRGLTIPNRIAMSPMCMYNAVDQDGTVGDFHLVHYGSRAVGGAGLIITEMTDVSPEGRISAYCAGMYKPEHVGAWRRVTDFVHQKTQAKIGVQLGHSGRKGGELRPWDRAASIGRQWQTLAPSSIPFVAGTEAPREVTRADMDRLIAAYANATRMSHEAGFDFVELHFAHGYLLSTFISPLSNKRTDQYGGSLANRLRFPMEVFEAVRAAWPQDKPTCVRISAHDWAEGGTTMDDAMEIGRRLKAAGNDILSVSTGGVIGVRPAAGRLYQAGFSDAIRNELKITTMNVGAMASHGDINGMIAAGRADMVALARGHLFDPYFTRHAAHQQGYDELPWPPEYERGPTLRMRDF